VTSGRGGPDGSNTPGTDPAAIEEAKMHPEVSRTMVDFMQMKSFADDPWC
jgi:hypothetical protein